MALMSTVAEQSTLQDVTPGTVVWVHDSAGSTESVATPRARELLELLAEPGDKAAAVKTGKYAASWWSSTGSVSRRPHLTASFVSAGHVATLHCLRHARLQDARQIGPRPVVCTEYCGDMPPIECEEANCAALLAPPPV